MSAEPLGPVERPAEASGVPVWLGLVAPWVLLVAYAGGFVLVGGGNLDLGESDARLGLAAGERLGPFGQVYGGWDPSIWPGRLVPSLVWAWGEGGTPTSASVRWPSAIAGVAAGLILAWGVMRLAGSRAGVLTGLCWFGSLALFDRSGGAGLDLLGGLAVIAALDRLLARGSDWVAGLWTALALVIAGWPPVALIALATVVLGRKEAALSARLLVPSGLVLAAWSGWALSVAPAEAWGAALALPFTEKPGWTLAVSVIALGLPWSPLALIGLSRSVREAAPPAVRGLLVGWLQVVGACLVAGTLIPGFAQHARVPALAGLAVVAALVCNLARSGVVSTTVRRVFLGLSASIAAVSFIGAVGGGIYLATAFPYYRGTWIAVIALALPMGVVAIASIEKADPRRGILAVAIVAVCLKLAHWGYFVPEWNYRFSQGPWGRAVGQWILPRWPVFTTHTWPHDFSFAVGRPVRQLRDPRHLAYQTGHSTKFVLLLDSEYENWPKEAPGLVKVASFQDERGRVRVLARTEGPFSWRLVRLRQAD